MLKLHPFYNTALFHFIRDTIRLTVFFFFFFLSFYLKSLQLRFREKRDRIWPDGSDIFAIVKEAFPDF